MALKITSDNIASATLSTLGGGVKITTVAYPSSATAANPAGGETITVTGSGFNSGIIVYINNTIPCATTYINNTSLTFVAPATGVGTYNIVLYNTDGSSGVKPIGIIFSSLPTWVTASGALTGAPINLSYSHSVSATGDGTITYSLTSGSLPSGLSLNPSTGAITGTAPNTTGTSTFTITASDSQNQTASRSFSITVNSLPTTVEYLVVAGGGSGGGGGQTFAQGGGGGAGGYRTDTGYTVTSNTPITITVGAGGSTGSAYNAGNQGSDSVFGTITSKGGGRGGAYEPGQAASTGGSGGGGGTGGPSGTSSAGAAGNTPTTSPSQGNTGGNANNPGTFNTAGAGGGGGGASAVGAAGSGGVGGMGGAGSSSSISGSSVTYAGGGGGGASSTGGSGGSSIGGAGGSGTTGGSVGTINTGSGGGGGGAIGSGGGSTGGAGGSGVVIIRYPDSYSPATSTTGDPIITTAGGYRVYKFTASGSITF